MACQKFRDRASLCLSLSVSKSLSLSLCLTLSLSPPPPPPPPPFHPGLPGVGVRHRGTHPGFHESRSPRLSLLLPSPPFSFLLLLPSSIPACLASAVARAARLSASVCPPVLVLPSPSSFFHPGLTGLCRGPRSSGLCVCLSVPLSWFSLLLPSPFFSPGTKPESVSRAVWVSLSPYPPVPLSWFSLLPSAPRGPSPSLHPTETHHPGFRVSLCPRVSLSPSFLHFLPPRDQARVRVPRSLGLSAPLSPCPPVLVLPASCFLLPGDQARVCIRPRRTIPASVCLSVPGSLSVNLPSPSFFHPGTKPESVSRAVWVSLSHCPPVPVLPYPASFFHPGLPGLCRGLRSSGLCVCLSPCPGSPFSFLLIPSPSFSPGTKPESASDRDAPSRLPCVSLSPGLSVSILPPLSPTQGPSPSPCPAQSGSLCPPVPLSPCPGSPCSCFLLLPGDQARVCIRPRRTIPASVRLAVPGSLSVNLPSPSFFHPGTKPESESRVVRVCLSPCPPVLVLPSPSFSLLPSSPRGPSPSLHPTETHHPGFRASRRPRVSVCLHPSSTFFHPGTKPESVSPAAQVSVISLSPPSPYLLCLVGSNLGPEPQPGFPTRGVALSLGSPGRRRLRSASSAPVVPVEV
eukprot:XP_017174210.1 PREDICTED: vegetative cell wall protein gp1-like [Mus musculus]